MVAFMGAAAVVAVALVRLWLLVFPARPNLVAGVSRWEQSRTRASSRQAASLARPGSVTDRIGAWLAELVSRSGRDLTSLRQDLVITGSSLEEFLSKMVGLVLVAFLVPPVLGIVLSAAGLGIPVVFGLIAGVAMGVAMAVLSVRDLRAEATGKRAELRRALSTYLDLVTMCLEAGRAPEEALPAAARIGAGWAFVWIQDAIETARWSSTTPGRELGELGRRIGMVELVDLESALELAWESGAKVKSSLVARAGTLRAQRVADTEADANQATESMKLALIPMVICVVIYELYPQISRLFAGG